MKALRAGSALLAATVSCALGVVSVANLGRNLPRAPAWKGVIAPLAAAPLPHGVPVGFIAQLGVSPTHARFLLLEAAWRRPDVWWTPMPEFPPDSRSDAVVTAGDRPAPPGWSKVWGSGSLRLFRRAPR